MLSAGLIERVKRDFDLGVIRCYVEATESGRLSLGILIKQTNLIVASMSTLL